MAGGKKSGKSVKKSVNTGTKSFGMKKNVGPQPFTTIEAAFGRCKVRNEKRDLALQTKATDFYMYVGQLADDLRDAKMTSTAKDFDTAATYIDDLLYQVEERDGLIMDLRDAVITLGDELNTALAMLKKAQGR